MKKNIVVVGYGGQGGWHSDHALKSDVVNLKGIFDIKQERIDLAKSRGINTYGSFEAVLADKDVNIVVCATPNDVHKKIVISALEAGKNVVCEKPVALSVEDFDDMCAAAKKAKKLFTVHQNRRWDVDYLAIKNLINSGEIGGVLNIESRVQGSRGIPSDWRSHKPQGGGMLLDWGVHLIDQMLQLIPDKIESIYCEFTNITNKEVDDGIHIHFNFVGDKRATVEIGTYNFIYMPRFYMQCEKGSAIIEDWQKNCRVAKLKAWNEKEIVPVQTAAGITKTMAPRDEITLDYYEKERPVSDVHDFYRNLVKAVDGKEEQLIKLEEVRRVLCVMQACFKSVEQKQVIKFEPNL